MKVFLSQVMRGRGADEILAERKELTMKLYYKYGPSVEVIDSYDPTPGNAIYKLGEAIQKLSEADAILFGPKALTAGRGTLVEYLVAKSYGIEIIDTY